ncbi:hypothetical protein [Flavihumibacter sp.]|uniref:hypothetical protein n=1 Tax=Flavihumibacter sp. TaxID=1913981 RepID=UPI002FC5B752
MKTEDEKVAILQFELLKWFSQYGRSFLWREKGLSDYQYIIAEVLLQRTRAETISKFYPSFISTFPSWYSLASARLEDIEESLRPIGLYRQRAARLQKLANEMVSRKGILPKNRSELEAISFMGQYIANAVEQIIFGQPTPLLDVNMARVIERVFEPRKLADIRYDPHLQQLSLKVIQHPLSLHLNWAILDFAALICTARIPKCLVCPINSICLYYKELSKEGKD